MGDEDEDQVQGSLAMTRTSHLFTLLHAPSEFDEDEDIECRLGATLYAINKPVTSSPAAPRAPEEQPRFFPPVSLETLQPLLCAVKKHDPVLFNCFLQMRIIVGEPPATEAKSWRRKRCDSIAKVKETGTISSAADPAAFVETGLAENSLHGSLCAALLLLEFPSTWTLKLGPVACKLLDFPPFLVSDSVSSEWVLGKILLRVSESASDFVARKCLGEKLTPQPLGIRSQHPMTFVYFNALLKSIHRRISSVSNNAVTKELSEALVYAARTLALNLWHAEVSETKPATIGLGRAVDAGEEPFTTLAAQSNAHEIVLEMRQTLLDLAGRIHGSDSNIRAGFEECALVWGAAIPLFYPLSEERTELVFRLLQRTGEQDEGHHFLVESVCARLSLQPELAKSLPLSQTMDFLLESIHKLVGPRWDRPSQSIQPSSSNSGILKLTPTQQVEVVAPVSPASSTGGASVFSVVSSRKRGDDEDDEEETIDEMGSVTGQTKARSIGTNSVASSLIAVAEEATLHLEQQDIEQLPSIVGGDVAQPTPVPGRLPARTLQQQASKSSIKSVTLDPPSHAQGPRVVRPQLLWHCNRTRLLYVLQGMCMVTFSPSTVQQLQHQSSQQQGSLTFDEARCAETIQVQLDGRKASQKADKKWGTAITGCAMNAMVAEVFRWRIKVDRCEDGHVFFGVATRDATSSSYLGEDANGWGFIGKGHLWHNREKKGAYGDPIRTGDVVTVTLDCKRGTLSFASATKDFGIAFKGLKDYCTGDSYLYPAVALYEKGDSVTLLPAVSLSDDVNSLGNGISPRGAYWSSIDGAAALEKCLSGANRAFTSLIVAPPPESFLVHLEAALLKIPRLTSVDQIGPLLSMLSGFCLWPNNCISAKLALRLLPKALNALNWCTSSSRTHASAPLASMGDLTGRWWFYDSSTTKHQMELTHDLASGTVRGVLHSKREGTVKVYGTASGQHLDLVEQWKSANRYVKLRLMPFGMRTALGVHQTQASSQATPHSVKPMIALKVSGPAVERAITRFALAQHAVLVLSSLTGKLCFALTATDTGSESDDVTLSASTVGSEKRWASSELFQHQKSDQASSVLLHRLDQEPVLRDLVFVNGRTMTNDEDMCFQQPEEDPVKVRSSSSATSASSVGEDESMSQSSSNSPEEAEFVQRLIEGDCAELDHWMLRFAGQAALVAKGGPVMALVRRQAIAALLIHSGIGNEARLIDKYFAVRANPVSGPPSRGLPSSHASPVTDDEASVDEELDRREGAPHPSVMLINVWRAATRVVSWAIREKQTTNASYEVVCDPLLEKAKLLLDTKPSSSSKPRLEYDLAASGSAHVVVGTVRTPPSDTELVGVQMDAWKRQARTRTLSSSRTHSESLDLVVNFFIDRNVDAAKLQSILADRAWRAVLRCAGFNATSKALQILDGCMSFCPGAQSCVLQWLPAASPSGGIGPLDAEPAPQIEELSQQVPVMHARMPAVSALDFEDMNLVPPASSATFVRSLANEHSDCLLGLDGCGRWPAKLVRTAFEALYNRLADVLSDRLQMQSQQIVVETEEDVIAVAELWNLPLRSNEDLNLLERAELIQKVKRVLDRAQIESKAEFDEFQRNNSDIPVALRTKLRAKSAVANSCLKLLASIAHQIVSLPANDTDDPSSAKAKLCDLIFTMAFHELSTVCSALEASPSSVSEVLSSDIFDEEYGFQLLQLLFSVSVTGPQSVTARFLCSSLDWVRLLIRVSRASRSVRIQQRALRLLGRVIPLCQVPDTDNDALTLVKDLLSKVTEAFPNPSSAGKEGNTVGRNVAAAECISILRKLMLIDEVEGESSLTRSKWQVPVRLCLTEALGKGESSYHDVWAALSVLGAFFDPLRVLGLVQFTPSSSQEFENALASSKLGRATSATPPPYSQAAAPFANNTVMTGVVVGLFDHKCQVAIPGIGQLGDDSENATEDTGSLSSSLRVMTSSRQGNRTSPRAMAAVLCEKSDVVPVSDLGVTAALSLKECSDLEAGVAKLFDKFVHFQAQKGVAATSEATGTVGNLEQRVADAVVQTSLARLSPMLVATEKFVRDDPARFRTLVQLSIRPTETVGLHDIHAVSTWWRALTDQWFERRSQPQDAASGTVDTDGSSVPPRTASAASQGALEEQMTPALTEMLSLDLGFPKEMCALALDRCGQDVEQAIHYCLEHAKDMETLIEEYRWSRMNRGTGPGSASSTTTAEQRRSAIVLEKLKEMGFPHTWCVKALEAVNHEGFNPALTWILANGDLLQEQDEAAEKASASNATVAKNAPAEMVAQKQEEPVLRLVCTSGGQATTLISPDGHVSVKPVTGLGGFPSVTARGLLLTKGRWYYEVTLETENCMQVGWADACFTGDVFEGTGVGDDSHSWAYDGYRKLKWHQQSTSWGRQWRIGDCIGCAVDLDAGEMWFSLNGNWEDGMGLAYKGLMKDKSYIGGLVPAVSFNRTERMRFNFGPNFRYPAGPPAWIDSEGRMTSRDIAQAFDSEEFNAKVVRRRRLLHKLSSEDEVLAHEFAETVDDCFEESIGDALSDRYFSTGQFASSSLLARRSSSGASGPSVGSGGGGGVSSAAITASNPFYVKDPFPRACALSPAPANATQALEELARVERTPAGDERIVTAIEAACNCLVTLYARAACLNLLLNWTNLDKTVKELIQKDLSSQQNDALWHLLRTCSTKLKIGDVLGATECLDYGSLIAHKNEQTSMEIAWNAKGEVLHALRIPARDLVDQSRELRNALFSCLVRELSKASTRVYASIPWDDSDLATPLVVHSIWQVTMDDATSHSMNELKLLDHPSVRFACWATDVLRVETELMNPIDENKRLVYAWALTLRSPSTRMKIVVSRMLLSFMLDDPEVCDEKLKALVDDVIATERIRDVAERLLSRGGTVSLHAVHSRYSLAMSELAGSVCTFTGRDDDEVDE